MAQKIQTIISTVDDLDNSQEATGSRAFEVGSRKFLIDLSDDNAARFDSDFKEWTTGLKKRTFALGKKTYTRWLSEEDAELFDRMVSFWTKAARRVRDDDDEPAHVLIDGRGKGPLETIIPVPVRGQTWWMDPERPFSRSTGEGFAAARLAVRRWAREHGWPELGERGMVPHEAYDRWFDEVWSAMDSPSWEQLARETPDPGRRASKPRRHTK
ncbi:Lsr2 dimerization domain-containing protein [Amycolatopsis minnesotensis]|uniref:Lsr2 dimerization domain-containing protein n=1 Tax=Amycolatopsis minnesotensis TaxID=337894 RepID=A0ABN2R126_9PSEU